MNTQNTLQDIEGSRVEAMVKPSAATRTMLFRIFHMKWHLHPNQFSILSVKNIACMIPHQKQRIWLFVGLGSNVPNSMRPPMALPCFANAMEPDGRQADCAEWKAASNIHLSSFMPALTVTNLVKLQAKKLGIAVLVVSTESMRFVWAIASANIFQAIQMLRKILERICLQHLLQAFGLSFMAGSLYSLYSIHCIQIMSQSSLQKDS